ncbi:hypothetical protein, partial [Lichenifustis flavocetrariae]
LQSKDAAGNPSKILVANQKFIDASLASPAMIAITLRKCSLAGFRLANEPTMWLNVSSQPANKDGPSG